MYGVDYAGMLNPPPSLSSFLFDVCVSVHVRVVVCTYTCAAAFGGHQLSLSLTLHIIPSAGSLPEPEAQLTASKP